MTRQIGIQIAAGVLSGSLILLSGPEPALGYLAFICLVPALAILPMSGHRGVLLVGTTAGIVSSVGKVYWIAETIANYGGLPLGIGVFTTALLVVYLSLYTLAFFSLASRLDPASCLFPWACASIWVALEWLQAHLLTGFPWMLLGYTQSNMLPVLQSARIWGVYGIGFLLVLVNASIAALQIQGRSAWKGAIGPGLLLSATLLYGLTSAEGMPREHALRVGIVQGSIPQGLKWHQDSRAVAVDRYASLTRELSGSGVDFIVLPETAFPFFLTLPANAPYFSRARDLAREMKAPILVGGLGNVDGKILNRVFLISPTGAMLGYQDKVHLVPFGEYLPLEWLFGYLEGLTRESGRFTPGAEYHALHLPDRDLPFGVFICYESIFPEIARTFARSGVRFLVNVTNDAWFGTTAAPYQHFAMGVFRAVENGLPLIRCANTGISGAVDASGRVLASTRLFEPTSLVVEIFPRQERTFYTRYGDLPVALCALISLGAFALQRRRR